LPLFARRHKASLHPAAILPALLAAALLPAHAQLPPADPAILLASIPRPAAALPDAPSFTLDFQQPTAQDQTAPQDKPKPLCSYCELDEHGNVIPLNRQQPKRILGFMPNFRTVSAGAAVHPPGWKYNFKVATRQSFDWSSFLFLGLTSLSAEGLNEHPVLGKGAPGFWHYTWRGFLDKTDGTFMQGFFLPSLLHEDTRYYPLGPEHHIIVRALYVISRQGVTRTYGGHQTPNLAGLGGKVLTQLVSRQYYPTGATSFGVLAEKFGYSAMRDVMFTSIREFYPDVAAHYIQKRRNKQAQSQAARDVSSLARAAAKQSKSPETEETPAAK
jgi:hypothetical protein